MTLKSLLTQTIRVIRTDKIVLVPYIIFAFMVSLLTPYFNLDLLVKSMSMNQFIAQFFLIHWAFDIVFMALTMTLAEQLVSQGSANVKSALGQVLARYVSLCFVTAFTVLPIAILTFTLGTPTEASPFTWWQFSLLIALIPYTVSQLLAPAYTLVSKQNGLTPIINSVRTIWKNKRATLTYLVSIMLFYFLVAAIKLTVSQVPIIGGSVLAILCQGIGYAIVYVMNIGFFHQMNKATIDYIS